MATQQGLQAKSFALAAEAYREAIGSSLSADSLQRITEGWGAQVHDRRQAEAEQANLPGQREESPQARRVAAMPHRLVLRLHARWADY